MISLNFDTLTERVEECNTMYNEGMVSKVIGLTIEAEGIKAFVGEVCKIYNEKNLVIECEVVGFKEKNVILMPLGELVGISPGCKVLPTGKQLSVACSENLFGKVLDGLGKPLGDAKISKELCTIWIVVHRIL